VLITLEAEIEELRRQPGALRENIVIALENRAAFRPGASLIASSGVEIALTMYCEPCKRIGHVVANYNEIIGKRGILGRIVKSGTLAGMDRVFIKAQAYTLYPTPLSSVFLILLGVFPAAELLDTST